MVEKRYHAAGGVVIHQDRMLLLERPAWNELRLPKGHVEEGESVTMALRETSEESGYADLSLSADLGSQVVEFEYKDNHVIRTEHYFLLKLVSERCIHAQHRMRRNFARSGCPWGRHPRN